MRVVVGFKVRGDAARSAVGGGNAAGVGVVGQDHSLILGVLAEIADDAADSVFTLHVAGVGAAGKAGRVVLDPADDAADVGRTAGHAAGVGAFRCADRRKRASAQAADAHVERVDGCPVGAVVHGQLVAAAVCADLADQCADIVIAVDVAAVDVHVVKGQVAGTMVAGQHGKAVFLVAV